MRRPRLKSYRLFYEQVPVKLNHRRKRQPGPKPRRIRLPDNILENLDNPGTP